MTRSARAARCSSAFLGTLGWLLLAASVVQAGKVKVWHHHSPAHYEKAQLKQTVVSSEGAVRLGRQLKPLARLQAAHVWDVVEDCDGNLLVATGDEGKLFRVTPDGKSKVLYTAEDSQILCLAKAANGVVYAGTGPSGQVLRIGPDGSVKVHCRTGANYVWALAVDATGEHVYAGTGPKGRIYRVDEEGAAQIFYETRQEHILCLAHGPSGPLYAGTDKGGLVYRIDANGKGFVLYSAAQAEVRSLLVTADGVYAGTSSPTSPRRGSSAGGSSGVGRLTSSVAGTGPAPTAATGTKPQRSATESGSSPAASASESSKSSPAPAAPPPGSGENSLYRIASDGTVREVFREKALLLTLLRQHGRLLVGTGTDGQLFEVDEPTKERCEIARLDHGQIHCLCRRNDGSIVLGTGDPGKLYVLQDRFESRGTVQSTVLDAKLISKWGSLRWRADTPPGTSVRFAVRSGNVAEPDDTWSDWSAEQTDSQEAVIAAPPARFVQYRVTLTSENPRKSPVLREVALRYMTANQAPEVTEIEVPNLDAATLDNPKKLKFKWSATDPNEDELTYSISVRKDGWKQWVLLEEGLEKREYEWDTTTTPSGTYQVRIIASDRKDNPAEDALAGERISGPFVVTHTPPSVRVRVARTDAGRAVIEANASDAHVRLTAASYSVDGKKWVNVFPTDGLFDSKTENFRFETEALKPGSHVLVLRVRDAAGNLGAADAVFTVSTDAARP